MPVVHQEPYSLTLIYSSIFSITKMKVWENKENMQLRYFHDKEIGKSPTLVAASSTFFSLKDVL